MFLSRFNSTCRIPFACFVLVALAALQTPSFAGNGSDITYQGTIVDSGGGGIPDGNFDIRIELFPDQGTLTPDLSVTVQNVEFQNATFAAQISDPGLAAAVENATDSWVGISVDLDNSDTFDADELFSPRVPLTAVARALYAEKATQADNADTATNSTQLGGIAASSYSQVGHTHKSAAITDFSDSVNNVDSIIALLGAMHTHSNKSFLDTINQNMATTNNVTFNSVTTTANVIAGTTIASGSTITAGTNITATLDAFVGDRLSVGTTAAALADLYISNGGNELTQGIRMENVATDNTNKTGRIKVGHYDSDQAPVTTLVHTNTSTANTLSLGGGSSLVEPAITDFHVYTGATTTTATGTVRFSIDQDGKLSTGGETAPDVSVGGLTLQQNNGDSRVLTLKASAVGHGVTALDETDTYGSFRRVSTAFGGLGIRGISETSTGLEVAGFAPTDDTTSDTGALAPLVLVGSDTSGTVAAALANDSNVMVVRNSAITRLIVKGDGDVLSDGSFTSNGFDMAEYFPAEETIAPSALVGLNIETGKVRMYRNGDVFVGIQSQNPAFVGNSPFGEDRSDHALVGLDGQFENVQGAVYEGNVAYTPDMRYRVGYKLANGRILLDKKEL